MLAVLEQFQNFATLEHADRVLREAAGQEARQYLRTRGNGRVPMSKQFFRSYVRAFVHDPLMERAQAMLVARKV